MKRLYCICFLLLTIVTLLSACGSGETADPEVTVSEDGYVIINGTKTEYRVYTEPVISIIDGYVAINGIKTEYEVKNKNHSYGEWRLYNTEESNCERKLYYRTCSDCSVIEWKEGKYEDHSFSTVTTEATCKAGGYDTKTCSDCGAVVVCNETPIAGHSFKDNYITDNSFHWKECRHCGETSKKAEHAPDKNGICEDCLSPLGPTEGIIYFVSSDGTYAEVVDYNGESKIVMIAEEYKGLPVRVIASEAFTEKEVVSVYIPSTITQIQENSFNYRLSAIHISDLSAWCRIDYGYGSVGHRNPLSFAHNLYLNGELIENLEIPEEITRIPFEAFAGCTSLKSVTIPDGVTVIEDCAFSGCTSLGSVSIPSSVTSIEDGAFYECPAVDVVDGIGYVDGWAVSYSGNAVELVLMDGTVGIASSVFYEVSKLRRVVLPDSMIYIGYGAFQSCENLSEINIPDGVKSIGSVAFNACDSLTHITIPNSVTYIGSGALNCESLSSIVFSRNVTAIEEWTFDSCKNLETVYYLGTAEEYARITAMMSNNGFTNADKYYYSETEPTEEGNYWHYVDGRPTAWQ